MDLQHRHHAVEYEVEFWPVEHPMEPQDEDRPVKCPMPTSSVIKVRICPLSCPAFLVLLQENTRVDECILT